MQWVFVSFITSWLSFLYVLTYFVSVFAKAIPEIWLGRIEIGIICFNYSLLVGAAVAACHRNYVTRLRCCCLNTCNARKKICSINFVYVYTQSKHCLRTVYYVHQFQQYGSFLYQSKQSVSVL